MELLWQGLAPFVERKLKSIHRAQAADETMRFMNDDRLLARSRWRPGLREWR